MCVVVRKLVSRNVGCWTWGSVALGRTGSRLRAQVERKEGDCATKGPSASTPFSGMSGAPPGRTVGAVAGGAGRLGASTVRPRTTPTPAPTSTPSATGTTTSSAEVVGGAEVGSSVELTPRMLRDVLRLSTAVVRPDGGVEPAGGRLYRSAVMSQRLPSAAPV